MINGKEIPIYTGTVRNAIRNHALKHDGLYDEVKDKIIHEAGISLGLNSDDIHSWGLLDDYYTRIEKNLMDELIREKYRGNKNGIE